MNVITIDGYRHGILTAQEFIEQGTTPGAIMAIAEHLSAKTYEHTPQPLLAAELRSVAQQVARITGQSLQIPGTAGRRAANDNRRNGGRHYGKPRHKRAA